MVLLYVVMEYSKVFADWYAAYDGAAVPSRQCPSLPHTLRSAARSLSSIGGTAIRGAASSSYSSAT